MSKTLDLTNKKFNYLTAIKKVENNNSKETQWMCRCDCGNTTIVTTSKIKSGHTKSCGCKNRTVNGLSNSAAYKVLHGMIQRCYNKNAPGYKNYGNRGIIVCDRWKDSFNNFYSDMGEKPKNMSIDRIDNDGNYEPSNCRWASSKEQNRNKRDTVLLTLGSKTMSLAAWADETGLQYSTLHTRHQRGWSDERTLTSPLNKRQ